MILYMIKSNSGKVQKQYARKDDKGRLWAPQGIPLLDGVAAQAAGVDREKLKLLVKRKKWDDIPESIFCREGENPCGRITRLEGDTPATPAAEQTAAEKERDEIGRLYSQARRAYNSDSEDNVMDYHRLTAEADKKMREWREKYPREWALERAESLESEADNLDHMAIGTLSYDMDGSIDRAGQQKRHDELKADAAQKRDEAKKIRESTT